MDADSLHLEISPETSLEKTITHKVSTPTSLAAKRKLRKIKIQRMEIENEHLKNDWNMCCSRTSPELIKYLVQVGFGFTLMVFAICKLATSSGPDQIIYQNILSMLVGLFLPSPAIRKKN